MLASKLLQVKSKAVLTKMVANKGLFTLNKSANLTKAAHMNRHVIKMSAPNKGFCALYYEKLYRKYLEDPKSVDVAWRTYFEEKNGGNSGSGSGGVGSTDIDALADKIAERLGGSGGSSKAGAHEVSAATRVLGLVRSYQTVGHEDAKTDPLNLQEVYGNTLQIGKRKQKNTKRLDHRFHGFTDQQLENEYSVDSPSQRGFLSVKNSWKLGDLIKSLKKAYCGSIGVEYMHIQNLEECNWIREKFEEGAFDEISKKQKLQSYDRLCWAVTLGDFLQSKYNTQKRFGLEGCDSFIPGLKCTIDSLVSQGCEMVSLGMPHRGRLNVLTNVLRKPLYKIFQEFQGEHKGGEGDYGKSGDVKYHLGTSYKRKYDDTGKTVEIHLLPNPSHLEAVDPVVCGFVRGAQHFGKDQQRDKNIGILIHGDAAFAGQGLVYETIQMAGLYNYSTGGTIHFIVNNQIGFTTTPIEARSGLYCTDLAKSVNAPIFHVNADDVLAVERVCRLAADYRMKFHKDVIIDIIGYRKYGHNELDQPSFTQPLMYEQIRKRENVLDIFENELVESGVFTKEEAKTDYRDRIWDFMNEAYDKARQLEADKAEWIPSEWDTIKKPKNYREFRNTGVELKKLKAIGEQICTVPEDFDAHKMIRKIYDTRLKSVQEGKNIDWGTAEALAFATLIDEDFHVRLSGQDVERGTFSHRHAHLHSQSQDEEYIPLSMFNSGRIRKFIATNSHLSENAVLGFEYGYSIVNPNSLTIWEAQFGDFYNGAQVIVDQFISSGETKWDVASGLVMLLPHGYDGAGPEHSSSRVERFLEMCDDDQELVPDFEEDYFIKNLKKYNWQVVNCSTAANYFHLLRRQMHRDFRKPLIVVAPKKLLKLKDASCDIEQFDAGLRFSRTIGERDQELIKDDKKVKRIVFCTGQVYYDLFKERKARKDSETAIVTIEQIFPMPYDHLKRYFEKFPNAKDIVWCQEEPKNYGAYAYLKPRFNTLFRKLGLDGKLALRYSGRDPNSSPATGYAKVHARQQKEIVDLALSGK